MTAQVKIARYVNFSYLALACYALIIFFFSLNTAWTGDDINYRYSFCNGKLISSISDIIQSQYTHYFNVNGRSIAHALVQLFIPILGRTAFAFFNALMHILFILQILKIAGVDKSNFRSILTVIFLSMTAFITKMLPTCQIGFVWMFTITLFFLNIFFGNYKTPKSRVLTLPALFILGILAGWSQEALIVGVGAALIYIYIYQVRNHKRLSAEQWALLVGFGIGGLTLCLSPGSRSRVSEQETSFLWLVYLFKSTFILISSISLLIIVIYRKVIQKVELKKIFTENIFFWIVWAFSITLNLYVGIYCNRQLFGAELAAIIIILRITKKQGFTNFWLCLLGIIAIYKYSTEYRQDIANTRVFNEMHEKYNASKDGIVYIDIFNHSGYNNPVTLFHHTPCYNENDYNYKMTAKLFHEDKANKGKPDVKIYPAYLKGKENVDLGNQAIDYGKGSFLVIISKNSPAKFKVHRAYTLFGLTYPYDTVDATSLGKVIMSSPLWDAYWISDGMIGVIPTAVTQE